MDLQTALGKRVEEALIRGTEAAAKKRHRTSTPVAYVTNPEKRAKSDQGQDREVEGPIRDPTPARPRDSSTSCEPQLKMSPAVRLERFQPLEKDEEMSGVIEGQGGIPAPMRPALCHQPSHRGRRRGLRAKHLRSQGHQPGRLPLLRWDPLPGEVTVPEPSKRWSP